MPFTKIWTGKDGAKRWALKWGKPSASENKGAITELLE